MAKSETKRIVSLKASSIAMFEGVFAAILGLGIAILHSLQTTVDIAEQTQSVFKGLAFGMAAGIVSVIVLPLVYFGIGWVIGYIHGFIFNVVAANSDGIVLNVEDA